jgi:hypothetical protein
VVISHYLADAKMSTARQLTIECDGSMMAIYNMELYTDYPSMDRILKDNYSNSIYSDVQSWKYAVAGSLITKGSDASRIHNTEVKVDKKKNRLVVESKTTHKSKTPIGIVSAKDTMMADQNLWFRCNTDFFKDMVEKSTIKSGNILMNFESQENLASLTDENEIKKKMKPILVSYPDDSNDSCEEQFYMFFTVSTKE